MPIENILQVTHDTETGDYTLLHRGNRPVIYTSAREFGSVLHDVATAEALGTAKGVISEPLPTTKVYKKATVLRALPAEPGPGEESTKAYVLHVKQGPEGFIFAIGDKKSQEMTADQLQAALSSIAKGGESALGTRTPSQAYADGDGETVLSVRRERGNYQVIAGQKASKISDSAGVRAYLDALTADLAEYNRKSAGKFPEVTAFDNAGDHAKAIHRIY